MILPQLSHFKLFLTQNNLCLAESLQMCSRDHLHHKIRAKSDLCLFFFKLASFIDKRHLPTNSHLFATYYLHATTRLGGIRWSRHQECILRHPRAHMYSTLQESIHPPPESWTMSAELWPTESQFWPLGGGRNKLRRCCWRIISF